MYYNTPFSRIIANKNKLNYPDYLNQEIALLSVNKDYSNLIGSASYRFAKYPSDYDIFEEINVCCSEEQLVNFFVKSIKRIVNDVINKKYHWFLELKCGNDPRFKLNIGKYYSGYFIINHEFVKVMNNYYLQNLISQEEINEINRVSKMAKPGQLEYEEISKIVREHYVIRWNAKEVLSGMKNINGLIIKLEQAVKDVSQINIEILAIVNDKVTDLSNFFILIYKDEFGKLHVINLPLGAYEDFYNFFSENLKKAIEKVALSILEFNPLKLVKRYWSYGKFTNDENLINKLIPILNSDCAYLGQIRSELKTIQKLVEEVNNYPKMIVENQLSTMKWKLSTILLLDQNLLQKISLQIDNMIDMMNNNHPKDHIVKNIEMIIKELTPIIDHNVIKYLSSVFLFPPPTNMLPIKKTY